MTQRINRHAVDQLERKTSLFRPELLTPSILKQALLIAGCETLINQARQFEPAYRQAPAENFIKIAEACQPLIPPRFEKGLFQPGVVFVKCGFEVAQAVCREALELYTGAPGCAYVIDTHFAAGGSLSRLLAEQLKTPAVAHGGDDLHTDLRLSIQRQNQQQDTTGNSPQAGLCSLLLSARSREQILHQLLELLHLVRPVTVIDDYNLAIRRD